MSDIQTPYDESSWSKYKTPIIEYIYDYYKRYILDVYGKEVQAIIDDCQDSKIKYKENFKWGLFYLICFCLPFSVILIIPAYWCIKKFNAMNAERKKLKAIFNEKNQDRLKNVLAFIHRINFHDLINGCFAIINYEPHGPIPSRAISIIKKYWPQYDNKWLLNTDMKNCDASSWGVYNKHMLIFNIASKKHWMGVKTYTETRTYTYTTHSNGQSSTSIEVVTATFTSPYPMYEKRYRASVFTTRAAELNFNAYFDKSERSLKNTLEGSYMPLENSKFNKEFPVARDHEVYFRIFFTADVQEYFVNRLQQFSGGQNFPRHYWWNKKGPFVYSQMTFNRPYYTERANNYNFINNVELELENVLFKCTEIILSVVYERFLSLNCATSLPCLLTEYNDQIINELDDCVKYDTQVIPEDSNYAHGVFTTMWETPIIPSDTEIMNVMHPQSKELVNGLIITKIIVEAHGNTANNKVAPVTAYGAHTGAHVINVPYVEYVPLTGTAYMYYTPIKCFAFYDEKGNDIGQMVDVFKQFEIENKIKIHDDHIIFVDKDDSQYTNYKQVVLQLQQFFLTKAKK